MSLVLIIGCQNIDKIEKPKKLLTKTEMKDLIYDMVLLDAAAGVNRNKLIELDIEILEFLSKKYGIDSNDLKENVLYYNLRHDDNTEIYEHTKDSIKKLEKAYDSISKVADSLRKIEKKKLDSISKATDSLKSIDSLVKTKKLKPKN